MSVATIYVLVAVASGAAGWIAASLFYGWIMHWLLEGNLVVYPFEDTPRDPEVDRASRPGYGHPDRSGAALHLLDGGDPTT